MTKRPKKSRATAISDDSVVQEIMTRGVAEIVPQELFEQRLRNGERMRLYLGVDPTGPDIHIGHAIILRKMRVLQDLGHEIILLIGDFTARIGDPTDRDAARKVMTHKEILANAKTYKKQAAKILDFTRRRGNPARLDFNARWLDKLTFQDVIELAAEFTVQQMLERDMFEKRMKDGKPIHIHEFFYPIMQGYDSVALDVDMEVGGTDQLFNMLAGRTLLKSKHHKEKVVMTFELLEGLDGRKMSKSFHNIVGVMDEPNDMYGKVMSVEDDLIVRYFTLCTDVPLEEVKEIESALKSGENPRDCKMTLARKIVSMFHSEEKAQQAEEEFKSVFQSKNSPVGITEHTVSSSSIPIVELMIEVGFAKSKSEARRLVEQGGVRLNSKKITDSESIPAVSSGDILQVGKRKFVTLKE